MRAFGVVMITALLAGCGQKGPLYRNAPVPDAVPSQTGDTAAAAEAGENADEDNERP